LVTRVADQKNLGPFIDNVEYIVTNGGQVVIGGEPARGDAAGEAIADKIAELEKRFPGKVKYYRAFVNRELAALIQAGGDFYPITSKFEPCGLTDIEASWLGNIPITRKTGGLGKVKNSYTYTWSDTSDAKGERAAFKGMLARVIADFRGDRPKLDSMRILGMRADFSWDIALGRYVENYRAASLFKVLSAMDASQKAGELSVADARRATRKLVRVLPRQMSANLARLLKRKPTQSVVERRFIAEVASDVSQESDLVMVNSPSL
jgi:glycogen synthase